MMLRAIGVSPFRPGPSRVNPEDISNQNIGAVWVFVVHEAELMKLGEFRKWFHFVITISTTQWGRYIPSRFGEEVFGLDSTAAICMTYPAFQRLFPRDTILQKTTIFELDSLRRLKRTMVSCFSRAIPGADRSSVCRVVGPQLPKSLGNALLARGKLCDPFFGNRGTPS